MVINYSLPALADFAEPFRVVLVQRQAHMLMAKMWGAKTPCLILWNVGTRRAMMRCKPYGQPSNKHCSWVESRCASEARPVSTVSGRRGTNVQKPGSRRAFLLPGHPLVSIVPPSLDNELCDGRHIGDGCKDFKNNVHGRAPLNRSAARTRTSLAIGILPALRSVSPMCFAWAFVAVWCSSETSSKMAGKRYRLPAIGKASRLYLIAVINCPRSKAGGRES